MCLLGLGSTILETSEKNSSKYKNKHISLNKIHQILMTEGKTFKDKLDCLNSSQEQAYASGIFNLIFFILCVCVFCLYVCLCSMLLFGSPRGQKRAQDRLELELWVVVSLHLGAGNETGFPVRATNALNALNS